MASPDTRPAAVAVTEAEVERLRHDLAVARDAAEIQRARLNRLLVAFHDATRRPLGVVPASGDEFYDHVQACRAEFVRPRIGSVAERDEQPETRLAAAEARAAKAVKVLRGMAETAESREQKWEDHRRELSRGCPAENFTHGRRKEAEWFKGALYETAAALLSDHPAPEPGVEAGPRS